MSIQRSTARSGTSGPMSRTPGVTGSNSPWPAQWWMRGSHFSPSAVACTCSTWRGAAPWSSTSPTPWGITGTPRTGPGWAFMMCGSIRPANSAGCSAIRLACRDRTIRRWPGWVTGLRPRRGPTIRSWRPPSSAAARSASVCSGVPRRPMTCGFSRRSRRQRRQHDGLAALAGRPGSRAYDDPVTSAGYLRFPHLHGDVLTFVAEDDIWLAAASGGRAWRVSADRAQVSHPRLAPGGSLVAWTSWRDGPPEVYVAEVDGDSSRRLSYWSDPDTRVCGWTPDGEILALTCSGQAFDRFTWAHIVPADAGPPRRLNFGPVSDVALESDARVLLNGAWGRDPAFWKRYRGGTSGRLWTAGAAGPFRRILADVPGQFASPMLARGRLAFLSDHEGTGNLYSCQLDGSGLLRHTDHDGNYARQASTDGRRVVYQCAGEIWILDDLEAGSEPRRVDITLGSAAAARAPRLVSAQDQLGHLSCDHTGRASAVEVRGTVHWLTHRDGPARALVVTPGGRSRLPQVLGKDGDVVWVTDADGPDALEIASAVADISPVTPRRIAPGSIGR